MSVRRLRWRAWVSSGRSGIVVPIPSSRAALAWLTTASGSPSRCHGRLRPAMASQALAMSSSSASAARGAEAVDATAQMAEIAVGGEVGQLVSGHPGEHDLRRAHEAALLGRDRVERAEDVGPGQADNLPATAAYDAVMELEQAIRTRRTHKAYRPEPVDRAVLDELFDLARWAPNHNLTNPWRFRVLGPRALERLKAVADETKPGSARKLDRAPTLVAACARQTGDPVQDREDLLAAAVAAYIVLLAAHARGLGGYWRTVSALDLPGRPRRARDPAGGDAAGAAPPRVSDARPGTAGARARRGSGAVPRLELGGRGYCGGGTAAAIWH